GCNNGSETIKIASFVRASLLRPRGSRKMRVNHFPAAFLSLVNFGRVPGSRGIAVVGDQLVAQNGHLAAGLDLGMVDLVTVEQRPTAVGAIQFFDPPNSLY